MTIPLSHRWLPAAALVLAAGTLCRAADPLPEGAKLRLGDTRFFFRFSPPFAPMPPDFKTLAFRGEGDGLRFVGINTGKDRGDKVVLSPGDHFILSADATRYALVRVIDVSVRDSATGKELQKYRRTPVIGAPVVSDPAVVSLSADGKRLAWGGPVKDGRGTVTVWDVDADEVLLEAATVHPSPAVPVLSPDGKLLATRAYPVYTAPGPAGAPKADDAPIVQVWDIAAKKALSQAKLTPAGMLRLTDMVFSADGSLLAASFGNGTIDWWDAKTGEARKPLLGRATQGQRLAFSPDGKTLASAGTNAVQRWATADGKPLPTTDIPAAFPAHFPRGMRFTDNERVLVWGYVSETATVWEAPAGKALTAFPSHTAAIRSIGFAAGGKEVVTSGVDARTVRWNAATGEPAGRVTVNTDRRVPPVLALSPDATRGISFFPPAVFDLKTGAEEFALPRGKAERDGYIVAVTPDASKVAVVFLPVDRKGQTTCAVWDLAGRRKVGEVEIGAGYASYPAVGLSPSGERVVTAFQPYLGPNGEILNKRPPMAITAWDVKAGKVLGKTEDVNVGQPAIAAASESYAVVASDTGQLRAYDFETGRGGDIFEEVKERRTTEVGPVVFSPDRKRFAVGRPGENPGSYGVRVYSWPEGKVLHTFVGHSAAVTAVAFSPDGTTLVTGSGDTTALLWDLTKPPVAK